jgi:hypothetical protein
MSTKERLIKQTVDALVDPEGVKAPGMCWRFQRLNIEALKLPSPGPGLDAKQAARWYKKKKLAIDPMKGTVPGDLYFWLDGEHGHVAMRFPGNILAENSSVHSHAGSDARGIRKLHEVRPPDIVVRFPEVRG